MHIVSGERLARRREIVSRPPENILSTAIAEPGHTLESTATNMRLNTYQEYTRCRVPCKKDLEIDLIGQTTSELAHMH
jgi:hypothetical protein